MTGPLTQIPPLWGRWPEGPEGVHPRQLSKTPSVGFADTSPRGGGS
jgi:hypothetical protein